MIDEKAQESMQDASEEWDALRPAIELSHAARRVRELVREKVTAEVYEHAQAIADWFADQYATANTKDYRNALRFNAFMLVNMILEKVPGFVTYSLNEWRDAIHDNAVEHGWWDEDRNFGEIIALCHSELSEALEEWRRRQPMVYRVDGKPEGVAVEMIDCMIRVLDWAGREGVDVDAVLAMKHEYNKGRPYRHGGKRA